MVHLAVTKRMACIVHPMRCPGILEPGEERENFVHDAKKGC